MSYDVPLAEGESIDDTTIDSEHSTGWQLWEVFLRPKKGLAYTHCGSVHAPDAPTAVLNARNAYTRLGGTASLWVVPSAAIHASDDPTSMFEPADDKPYRHPTFYEIPDEVGQL